MNKFKVLFRLFEFLFYVFIIVYFYIKNVNAERAALKGSKSNAIPIGIILEKDSDEIKRAFEITLQIYNSKNTSLWFPVYIDVINTADVFKISRLICKQYTKGSVAMLGSVQSDSFTTLHTFANTFNIPFVTPWFPEEAFPSIETDYAISLRPDYHRAVIDTIKHYGWNDIIYIYDSDDGLLRLESILKNTMTPERPFRINQVRRVSNAKEVIDFLVKLEQVDPRSQKYVVLDSSTKLANETMARHMKEATLIRQKYHYFLTGFLMDGHWSEYVHTFKTLNITGFCALDYSTKKLQDFLKNWNRKTNISSKTAMMVDSLNLIIEAIKGLVHDHPEFPRMVTRRSRLLNKTNNEDCDIKQSLIPFKYGGKLSNIIKMTEHDGLSGHIKFDLHGRRRNFLLHIVEMTANAMLRTVRTWYQNTETEKINDLGWVPPNQTKTYIIASVLEKPFFMPFSSTIKYKGFCVDLAELIMKILGLSYEFHLVRESGLFGPDIPGGWDGVVGELTRKEADLSISSLKKSALREEVIEFSRTLLSLDDAPEDEPKHFDSVFIFLKPLSMEIWLSILGGFVGVSICLYMVSKYSPNEYQLRSRTNENTQSSGVNPVQVTVENTFTLRNAIWFSLSSFMQQSSGYSPRSLSGRIISGVWWLVILFVITIYTAALTLQLTLSQLYPPFNLLSKCPAETNKACKLRTIIMETGLKDFAIAFPKDSPLREGVNLALQQLRNNGEIYRLIHKWFIPESYCDKNHGKELTFEHLAGLYFILLVGIGLGLIIGFINYIVYRRKRQEEAGTVSPPGTPVRAPSSPIIQHIKSKRQRTVSERESIDWNAANYVEYGSPSNEQCEVETAMHDTFMEI